MPVSLLRLRRLARLVPTEELGKPRAWAALALPGAKNFGIIEAKLAGMGTYACSSFCSAFKKSALVDFALTTASQPHAVNSARFAE